MTRIAIVGNGGGGKSTLAVALGRRFDLPVHHIDKLQYRPGWQPTPHDELAAAHEEIVRGERWIVDGWGTFAMIARRFARADAVVLVDFALWRHLAWAMKRQLQFPFAQTFDRPPDCPLLPRTWDMLRTIWRVHHQLRPRLVQMVQALPAELPVYVLRSPRALAAFRGAHGLA